MSSVLPPPLRTAGTPRSLRAAGGPHGRTQPSSLFLNLAADVIEETKVSAERPDQTLNEGLGQGIWFHGHLLVAVSMEVLEGRAEPEPLQAPEGSRLSKLMGKKKKTRRNQTPTGVPRPLNVSSSARGPEVPSAMEVEVEELLPLPQNALAPCEDFLLFGVLFEATMIDPAMAMASQPISFEISIGHAGHQEEQMGQGSKTGEEMEGGGEAQPLLKSEVGDRLVEEQELGAPAQRPEPIDGSGPCLCLPLSHRKPCMRVWSRDHTWRLHSSNCVQKVAQRLDQGLQEVESLQRRPGPGACTPLKQALEELVAGSKIERVLSQATNLAPADLNGKADPYVVVSVGWERQDTKEHYIPKQLNPIFGEVLELSVSLPAEPELTVAVFDHDLMGSDDLIGETHIDLENRFYSHHSANCGLASQCDVDGYNAWRGAFRPSQILAGLCQRCGLPTPEYRVGAVKVGSKVFLTPPETWPPEAGEPKVASEIPEEEGQALLVLRRWQEMPGLGVQLVPEHMETRPLYYPRSPGLLQGSLQLWIDIFPDAPVPPPVDIKPQQPISYELRVIIWNTEDVVLGDVILLTREMSSDIYVKSWVKGLEQDKQETDVHFNSLTGEGNFNWRFVFRFDYLPTEREVSIRSEHPEKPVPFTLEEAEFQQPAVLDLQVWDYDRISANDFLGSLELQLPDLVLGPELCSVWLVRDGAAPRCSLFCCPRLRVWPVVKLREPEDKEREQREAQAGKKRRKRRKGRQEDFQFTDAGGNAYIVGCGWGKVEAEFELLTVEGPVGKGRKKPGPLEKSNRPQTSFNWFVNPLKTFIFFIWLRYLRILVLLLLLAQIVIFLLLVFYTITGQISEAIFRPLQHPPGPTDLGHASPSAHPSTPAPGSPSHHLCLHLGDCTGLAGHLSAPGASEGLAQQDQRPR
ncbi:LOW QUALITY PROTEIN: fer-1-like protein 4 [Rhynchonycteris naso]